jgi:hypothetical protein
LGLFGKKKGPSRAEIDSINARTEVWAERLWDEVGTWEHAGGRTRNVFRATSTGGAVLGVNLLWVSNSMFYRAEGWPEDTEEQIVRRARWTQVLIASRIVAPDFATSNEYMAEFTAEAEPGISYEPPPEDVWVAHLRNSAQPRDGKFITEPWMPHLALWLLGPLTVPRDPEWLGAAMLQASGNIDLAYSEVTRPDLLELNRATGGG